jgi:UDP-N-acetylglucosamine diphosphorylase/glucosamine-1-phosphate N-acetyltransferase
LNQWLILFEDPGWRSLRPLTDLTPVPALAFGGSNLADRLLRAAGLPLLAIEARPDAMRMWREAPVGGGRPASGDVVIAINAAALPGPWLGDALRGSDPAHWRSAGRLVGARLGAEAARPGLGRGAAFATFLEGLTLPARDVEARLVRWPWNLVEWNAEAISADLATDPPAVLGSVHPRAELLVPERIRVDHGARVDPLAVLDARAGPIRIEAGASVLPGTVVAGPCVVGRDTQLLGGFVGRSTIGPECRIAGEVEECIWQGFGNKRHHGFVGHSVIGEWVNLGALTTTSDLKNNYGTIRVWVDGREIDSGIAKIGSLIGAHAKTGIGTLLPTGGSIGVGSNLFGGGRFAPKHVPPFSWWDGDTLIDHRVDAFLRTMRIVLSRRGRELDPSDAAVLERLFDATRAERASP